MWKTDVGGGAPTKVTDADGYAALESLDGRWLDYTSLARGGLWRRAVDGGGDRLFSRAVRADEWANVGVVDGGAFFLAQPDAGDPELVLIQGDPGRATPLMRLSDLAWSGVTMSRDGTRALYARADRRESNIMGLRFDPPTATHSSATGPRP